MSEEGAPEIEPEPAAEPAPAPTPTPAPALPRVALGLDFGTRRIGVAVIDGLGLMAHPLVTLANDDPATLDREIAAIAREREVEVIVIGLPVNMDGTRGPSARAALAFARKVEALGWPVETIDERLTTHAADDRLRQAGIRDWRERKRRIDQASAALILEGWLERQRKQARRAERGR